MNDKEAVKPIVENASFAEWRLPRYVEPGLPRTLPQFALRPVDVNSENMALRTVMILGCPQG
jgi:hypothetical protein